MDKMDVAGGRAYEEEAEELDPEVEWRQAGDEQDVVEIRLPGFRKEHVRVQVDNYGVLRVTGGRPARGRRWVRFTKDLRLPDGCDADGVRARFEDDRLLITLPIVPAAATAGDAPSPATPSPEPFPRTSSFQPPPPPLPPPPGKPNFFEPKLRPPVLPPRPPPPPPPPVQPTAFEPKLRPPPREPLSRPLPSFPAKPPTVFEPKPPPPPPPPAKPTAFEPKPRPPVPPPRDPFSRPLPPFPATAFEPKPRPPPPPPPAKPTAFEPKLQPPLPPPREPSSRPLPPFPENPSTAFEPKPPPPPPPREPTPAPLFPSRPPPPPATSTSFMSRPPPPPREPPRLPSFPPPPPPAKPTFSIQSTGCRGGIRILLPSQETPPPQPLNGTWAPPAIVPRPKAAEPEPKPTPPPPPLPPRKQSTPNVPEPKAHTLSDIPKSPILSDIPIAMSSPSPPPPQPPPPPPPRWRLPDAKDKTKKHGNAQEGTGRVRLPLLEEMKKKEEKKMEGRKAREAANVGNGTPPAVNERSRREVTPNLLPPASRDPTSTTELVANMAAAAAVLVGIAVSVWHTISGSS